MLVDEYQDTNRAQYRWLQLLAEEHRNLCVVGDDDQSIYRFRGADIRNILDFEDDFPDAHTVKLEQNYRSTQTILDGRQRRDLPQPRAHGQGALERPRPGRAGAPPRARGRARRGPLRGQRDRAPRGRRRLARRRRRLLPHQRPVAGARGHAVRYQVGYQVIGGTRFYERAEIKDALAYLTLLVNPHDTVSFGRVVNSPRRGIGDTSQARITGYANTMGEPVFDVAAAPEDDPGPRPPRRGRRSAASCRPWNACASGPRATRPSATCSRRRWRRRGYLAALEAERTIESQGRLENLEELVSVAREYETTAEEPSVEEFLQQIALFSQQDDLRDEEGIVTLMTLHNAKGLEFEIVFMIGCEDGVFPHSRAVEAGDLEEERRLCYVGLTRARRELYVTHARTRVMYGGRDFNLPSRFIAEIPAELTDADRAVHRPGDDLELGCRPRRRPRRRPAPRQASPPATTWCTRASARA